jgi:predicted Holliday junction resolvase-like endonuclease
VVLALPAIAAYYKLIVEKGSQEIESESLRVQHVKQQSHMLFLTVFSVSLPGALAGIVLYNAVENTFLELALGLIIFALLLVVGLTYDWYHTISEKLENELADMIKMLEDQIELLEDIENEFRNLDIKRMKYIEKKRVKEKLEEDLNKINDFKYDGSNLESLMNYYLYDYYPRKKVDLFRYISTIQDIKKNLYKLPTVSTIKKTILSPIRLGKSIVVLLAYFGLFGFASIVYSALTGGVILSLTEWILSIIIMGFSAIILAYKFNSETSHSAPEDTLV